MKLLTSFFIASLCFAQDDPSSGSATATLPDPTGLTAARVQDVVQRAASSVSAPLVIAVTDRQGNILGVYRKAGAPVSTIGNFSAPIDANEAAVGLARTASFFSHNQAPLSSRTVRFISGVHFPPGIMFTGPADLYGIENTNRGCLGNTGKYFNVDFDPGKSLPAPRSLDGTKPGTGIMTGKADLFDSDPKAVNAGGVPLYINGRMVGGVGVVGPNTPTAEYAAFTAAFGGEFGVAPAAPGVVIIGGIALPFVIQTTLPAGLTTGSPDGDYLPGFAPIDSPGPAPDGNLLSPHDGANGLTAADVQQIINNATAAANSIRGVIRLPIGTRAKMVFAVADLDGSILGLNRMPDATIFSVDVAVTKSRNVISFTNYLPGVPSGTSVTNRTIGFGAQPFYPPGIDFSSPGPFFDLFKNDVAHPCTQGGDTSANGNQSGIIFFPGAVPLYKNGILVGGLGVSGDGVDQDDYVTNAGSVGFEAPLNKRADQIILRQVRLPYLKFPRDPQN